MLRNTPLFRRNEVISETLYSNFLNLARGKIVLTLLHIPAVGYNLAGSWRDLGRFPSRCNAHHKLAEVETCFLPYRSFLMASSLH
jgi:hypothetical protein